MRSSPGAPGAVPLLPLRDVVVFPHMVIPLFVGREKSILALEAAMGADKRILLVAQRNAADLAATAISAHGATAAPRGALVATRAAVVVVTHGALLFAPLCLWSWHPTLFAFFAQPYPNKWRRSAASQLRT